MNKPDELKHTETRTGLHIGQLFSLEGRIFKVENIKRNKIVCKLMKVNNGEVKK